MEPRWVLYTPDDSCPMPLKWLDVHRVTMTNLEDKVEKENETNAEGSGMEVNNGQEANGEAIQDEAGVNGGAEENMEEN